MPIMTTLAIIAISATVAGTVMSIQQARQQAKTSSAFAEHRAQTARQQAKERAEALRVAGRAKQEQILEERRRILARNRAKFGKGGVILTGSPLLVQQEVAKIKTQDAVMENYNTQIEVRGALTRGESEAQLSLLRGEAARATGRLQVGQALFSGVTQAASIGLDIKRAEET